jgi:hypothetical protein
MEQSQQTTKEYFKMLTIIHIGLTMGLVLFGLVISVFIIDFNQIDTKSELAKLFDYLVPGLIVVGIVASNMISKIKINALKVNNDLRSKLRGYTESLIIRYALLEGPGLFALVTIFITNDFNYFIYAGIMVVLLIIKRPTMKSVIAELELDQQEITVLENSDSII